MPHPPAESGRYGAYGLHLSGAGTARRHLVVAPEEWPTVRLEHAAQSGDIISDRVDDEFAEYRMTHGAGTARITRRPLTVRFCTAKALGDQALLHPGLALPGAIIGRWLGRDSFHAGAFVAGGGAWAVLGAKEAGKSSLLGLLSARGLGIVCDDLLVVDHGRALPGPRCIDLREGAAAALGQGADIGVVGLRRRWRARPAAPVPAAVPLRGWIVPGWADAIDVRPIPAADRLPILVTHQALNLVPTGAHRLLRLAGLPFLSFSRPRCWERADAGLAALLDAVGDRAVA